VGAKTSMLDPPAASILANGAKGLLRTPTTVEGVARRMGEIGFLREPTLGR